MKIKIISKHRQRNGISGLPFLTVLFLLTEDGHTNILIATASDKNDPTTYRVIDPMNLENCYRGDTIGHALAKKL